MKNILSYSSGRAFYGREIMDWSYAFSQAKNKKGKYARYILKHYRLIPDRRYNVYTYAPGTSCNEIRHLPYIVKENYVRTIY